MKQLVVRLLSINGVPITVALAIMVVVFGIISPVFFDGSTLFNYLNIAVPLLLLSVGVAIVMIGGGIDLSVGTVAGLGAGVVMWALVSGAPTWLAALAGIGTGLVFGLFNGLLITRFGISDFIVTLATLNIAGGLLVVLTGMVSLHPVGTAGFSQLGRGSLVGVPTALWIAAVLFVVVHLVLTRTAWGRRIFAIGIAPDAANIAGVNVRRARLLTFTLSGVIAGCAGVLLASRLGTVQAFLGNGYEFTAIAGAVLGGVSLAGGRGSVWAAVAGALLLQTLQQGLRLNGVDPLYFQIVTGLCIVAGVIFDRRVRQLALSMVRNRTLSRRPPTSETPSSPIVRSRSVDAAVKEAR
jgi:ribose/xylose/arabinose/galactoside ABC-type transport system permease subunit